jgi:hypothetical protein
LLDYEVSGEEAREVINELRVANLLPEDRALRRLLSAVKEYVRVRSLEGGVNIDPATGLPTGLTGKIIFGEPTSSQANRGFVSIDHLIEKADAALAHIPLTVWLLLDRLDVAFAENPQLEENALRALFKVYLDLAGRDRVRVKIFLRSDIWRRITSSGFREASHITRHTTIRWNQSSLLNLVMRRVVQSAAIREAFSVNASEVLQSSEMQVALFDRMFPDQVDVGQRKPRTIDWMLSRTMDGSRENAPRELIHLLNATRLIQIRQLETGEAEPEGELLFSRSAIKAALPEVSKVRLEVSVR